MNRREENKAADFTSETYFRERQEVKHREEDKRAEMTVLDLTTANRDEILLSQGEEDKKKV